MGDVNPMMRLSHWDLISSLIHLCNALMECDYRKSGRTDEVMGIQGMDAEDFLNYIQHGVGRKEKP